MKLVVAKLLGYYLPIKNGKQIIALAGKPIEIEWNGKKKILIVDVWKWAMEQKRNGIFRD